MVSTWSPGSHGWLLRIFTLSFCPALGLGFLRYDQTDTWWAFQPWYCFWISVYQMSWCSSLGFLKVLQSHCQKQCSSRTTARDNLLVPGEYFAWWEDRFDGFQALICFWDGWLRGSSGRSILCEESWKETLFQLMFMGLMFLVCYPAVRAHEIQLQSTSLPELWGISQILNENSAIVIGLILLINFHTHSLAVLKCKLQTTTLHVISLVWWHVFSPLTSTYWFPWDVSEISRLLPSIKLQAQVFLS